MKELRGSAAVAVGASADECFELLVAVEGYPTWYPEVVREVEVVERDPSGGASRARTKLHVSQGPLAKDFDLLMAVSAQRPTRVTLGRIRNDARDAEEFEVSWYVDSPAGTLIRLELRANLSVPRLLPVGGIGNSIAQGFVAAAARAVAAGRA